MQLVKIVNNEAVTSTEIIAEMTNIQHKNIIALVRNYTDELSVFGQVAFETRAGYQNALVEFANLNERQATLLISFMRNTAIVKEFKIKLVSEFYAMAEKLKTMAAPQPIMVSTGNTFLDALIETQRQTQELKESVSLVQNSVGSALEIVNDVQETVLAQAFTIANTNIKISGIKKDMERVNVPKEGYITAGEAVRTIFPEISKGAMTKMLASYGSEGIQYTYFVEGVSSGKVGTTLQYPIADVKVIKTKIMREAVKTSETRWKHPLNPNFVFNIF